MVPLWGLTDWRPQYWQFRPSSGHVCPSSGLATSQSGEEFVVNNSKRQIPIWTKNFLVRGFWQYIKQWRGIFIFHLITVCHEVVCVVVSPSLPVLRCPHGRTVHRRLTQSRRWRPRNKMLEASDTKSHIYGLCNSITWQPDPQAACPLARLRLDWRWPWLKLSFSWRSVEAWVTLGPSSPGNCQ